MEKIITLVFGIISIILLVLFYKDMLNKSRENKKLEEKTKKENEYKYGTLIPYFIHQLELAKDLNDIFILHLRIWGSGIRHKNFGPDNYGIFRTDDIMTMNPGNVYLYIPEITFTLTIPELEKKDKDSDVYKWGVNRYRNHLISNLKAILNEHGK